MSTPPSVAPAPSPVRATALRRLLPWLVAAAFAIACAWLARLQLASQARCTLLADQQRLAELELRSVRQQLEAERILNRRQLTDSAAALAQRDQQLAEANRRVDLLARVSDEANRRLSVTDAQLAALRQRLRTQGDLAQLRIATLASPAGSPSPAAAVVVWSPSRQQGVLQVEKLPAPAPDQDYQLWLTDPAHPQPVDAGVFPVDPASGSARVSFRPNSLLRNAPHFAIRLEKKGGAPKPAGPVVLLGQ